VAPDPREIERILPVKQAVEDKLILLPGVTGVDVGLKEVGGEQTDTHAILVFVERKGEFEPREEIPKTIEGVPTDVIEATFRHQIGTPATASPDVDTKRYDPLQGGACISPGQVPDGYGTVGMIVIEDRWSDEVPMWLSAYHVMCPEENWWTNHTKIIQPAICFGGKPETDTIGEVRKGTYGEVYVRFGYNLYVDAAICETPNRAYSKKLLGLGVEPRGARAAKLGGMVKKYGATTGERQGQIESTNFTAKIEGTIFYYQYRAEAAPASEPPLSEKGDSGAAVIDEGGYAIGLIIAGDEKAKKSVINPIEGILSALEVRMPT
jgi:hypothetical protein